MSMLPEDEDEDRLQVQGQMRGPDPSAVKQEWMREQMARR